MCGVQARTGLRSLSGDGWRDAWLVLLDEDFRQHARHRLGFGQRPFDEVHIEPEAAFRGRGFAPWTAGDRAAHIDPLGRADGDRMVGGAPACVRLQRVDVAVGLFWISLSFSVLMPSVLGLYRRSSDLSLMNVHVAVFESVDSFCAGQLYYFGELRCDVVLFFTADFGG